MNDLGNRRLLKLAAFLRTVPRKHFNLDVIANNSNDIDDGKTNCQIIKRMKEIGKTNKKYDCGAAACAIGWMPAAFPRQCKWSSNKDTWYSEINVVLRSSNKKDFAAAKEFFDICEKQADYLFQPDFYPNSRYNSISPKTVAKRIEKFVKTNGQMVYDKV